MHNTGQNIVVTSYHVISLFRSPSPASPVAFSALQADDSAAALAQRITALQLERAQLIEKIRAPTATGQPRARWRWFFGTRCSG